MKKKKFLLLLTLTGLAVSVMAPTPLITVNAATFTVVNPKCEYRTNPLGIQTATPQFSWNLDSTAVGEYQNAYQILVASTQANLNNNIGDKWDSGQVNSSQNLYVKYNGTTLQSATKYYWKVKVWDKDNAAQWSAEQTFAIGKLNATDWQGSWICSGVSTKNAIYLRKEFNLSKTVSAAYLNICGLGAADVYLNGQRLSEELISTSPTNFLNTYNSRTYTAEYNTYDLSSLLVTGNNCVGVILGNAYYHSDSWLGQYNIGDLKMIADLNIKFTDGTTQSVCSDTTWKWSYGAIKYHDMRYGQEDIDMRDRMPGWNNTGFNDAAWTAAQLVSPQLSKSILKSKQEPPIVVYKTTNPGSVNGSTYTFPEYLAGHVRFKASGGGGTQISVNNTKCTSIFTLSGNGTEEYEQRFDLQGTRSVSISGTGATISEVRFVSTAAGVAETGSFTCNDPTLNMLSQAGYKTARLMTMGGLGFEAEREKCGWGEDGKNALDVNIYAADMLTIGRKWVWDYLDRQEADGSNPSVIPMINNVGYNGIWQGGALNYVAWDLYQQYGDKRILEEAYNGMKKTMDFLASQADGNHFMGWTLNEWGTSGATPPAQMTGTIQYYDYARTMEKTATVLGNATDATYYGNLANTIRTNYNNIYWNNSTGYYENAGTRYQSIQAMAAWFGMVPDGKYSVAVGNLKDMVIANNYHPATGFSATASLLGVMMREYPDVAYGMLTQTESPSFLSNINEGLCCEFWSDSPRGWASLSGNFNRYVYDTIAGIQPLEPGFKKIGIFPVPCNSLNDVDCYYDSVYGRIVSNPNKSLNIYTNYVTIPSNTTAVVGLPKAPIEGGGVIGSIKVNNTTIWSNGTYTGGVNGITYNGDDGKYLKFNAVPGAWNFEATTTITITPTPTPRPAAISYTGTDTTTQGTWKSVYGSDGYDIINSGRSLPSYVANLSYVGGTNYTWNSSTSDVKALQKPDPATDRILACRYDDLYETIDLTINSDTAKPVAIYFVDPDNVRITQVQALDGESGTTLDTREVTSYANGNWLKYNVIGHVKFKVIKNGGGQNAVFSGVFFGGGGMSPTPTPTPIATPTPTPAPTASGANTVTYSGIDTVTQGTWKGVYGFDGYDIINSGRSLPSYVTNLSYIGGTNFTWNSSTSDVTALQKPDPATDRILACRYDWNEETIDLTIGGDTAKSVAIYFVDPDNVRITQIQALDGDSGATLDTRDLTSYANGKWLKYNVKGHIKFKVIKNGGGQNAVFSGVFFGGSGVNPTQTPTPTPTSTPTLTPTPTPTGSAFMDDFSNGSGNWTANVGTWAVESEEYSQSASGDGNAYIPNKTWGNATFEADLKCVNNGGNSENWGGFLIRKTSGSGGVNDGQLILCRQNGEILIYRNGTTFATYQSGLNFATMTHFKVTANGQNIKVYINGGSTPCIDYNDLSGPTNGYFSIHTWDSHWHFDNVSIQ